ncbi:D-alanyl-D-alanine carboxypeptidase family protein [Sporosarcina sp. HYO08]|uniref:D-alanyl-D-alanine carboxypeptidase family protein n=1 Tax=Sporosarcina sp. HYO08 TaxID=1759557 RepID=UPI000795D9BD|nr:D-alanyl-D-alanine carboxypeptidase family protein [Sporosarcina sp. HYO08]KXH82055.1 D-alanyl-D-alanine carboxypeptidase [Sporosarcina sp. HYO08]
MKRALFVFLLLMLCLGGTKSVQANSAQAWAVIDADTGRLLDGRNANEKLPIASLTKIWTAFTFLESGALPGEVPISAAAAVAEGSSLYLKQNTTMDSEALLYGLMLRSGNDAAHALAEYAGGSVEGFVDLMNEKALYYGLQNTYFANPSGLHHDAHLSTAYETALMMYYAMRNEKFREIASAKIHTYEGKDQVYSWGNKHRLVRNEPTAIAGKTGFTKAAGRTLVTYFEKDGKSIIVCTLNDGDDWRDHMQVAEDTFSKFKLATVVKKGTYKIQPGVKVEVEEPIKLLIKNEERKNVRNIVQIPRGKHDRTTGLWSISMDHSVLLTKEVDIQQ